MPTTPASPESSDVRRAVFAVESELQRVPPGHQGVAFPDGLALGRGKAGDLLEDRVQFGAGVLVVGVEGFLAFLDPRHLGLQGGELGLGLAPAFLPGGE